MCFEKHCRSGMVVTAHYMFHSSVHFYLTLFCHSYAISNLSLGLSGLRQVLSIIIIIIFIPQNLKLQISTF